LNQATDVSLSHKFSHSDKIDHTFKTKIIHCSVYYKIDGVTLGSNEGSDDPDGAADGSEDGNEEPDGAEIGDSSNNSLRDT